MNTLTYLQPGMRVNFEGRPHRVVMVNECRARIVPEEKRHKEIIPATGRHAGQRITILADEAGHNISPNSELEVL